MVLAAGPVSFILKLLLYCVMVAVDPSFLIGHKRGRLEHALPSCHLTSREPMAMVGYFDFLSLLQMRSFLMGSPNRVAYIRIQTSNMKYTVIHFYESVKYIVVGYYWCILSTTGHH